MTEKSVWLKAVRGGKTGFDRLWGYADKLGAPVNKLSNKIGSEAFWPTSIDKESYKAARILRSFCRDGGYEDVITQAGDGPQQKQRVIKTIPSEVIKNAKGLAIFTTMRTGLWFSGAGGSGVLVARMDDGTWSPPSGILLHTAAIGFLVGVDIYDCVLVLNSREAVNAFAKWRFTLGGEISAVAGPVGIGGILDTEVHTRQAPIFTYLRSRGFYAGVQIDGTVILERTDENEKYYGSKYSAVDIISGKVRHPPRELKMLSETLRASQGDSGVDESALPTEAPPADFEVVKSDHVFGIPDKEDPDPFGVLALEKEGFQIKEAGSNVAPSSGEFEFRPNTTSPIFDTYNRSSFEGSPKRNSWRSSSLTVNSVERRYVTIDTSTQTDFPEPTTPMVLTPGIGEVSNPLGISTPSGIVNTSESNNIDQATQLRTKRLRPLLPQRTEDTRPEKVPTAPMSSTGDDENSMNDDVDDDDDDDDDEEAVIIQEVHQATRPQLIVKPRVVTVPARMRPDVPARNPTRMSALSTQLSLPDISTDGEGVAGDHTSVASRPSSSDKDTLQSQDGRGREDSVTSTTPSQKDPDDKSIVTTPLQLARNITTPADDKFVDVKPPQTPPSARKTSPSSGGALEIKPSTPITAASPTQPQSSSMQASPATNQTSFAQASWRPSSHRFSSPRASMETVRSDKKEESEQEQFKPFDERFTSPWTSLEPAPLEAKIGAENGQWRPSNQRFSVPRSSPRSSLEFVLPENKSLCEQKQTASPTPHFSLPSNSNDTKPSQETPKSDAKLASMVGPRISLANMKLRLDDDDDDDDDYDDYDHRSPGFRRRSSIKSPLRSSVMQYDEDFS